MDFHENFCGRLRELRQGQGLSLDAFANLLGQKRSTVNYWELGKNEPPLNMIGKIAEHFEVSVDYLLGRTDNREINR